MTTIYKYELQLVDSPSIEMQAGARILHVANQRETICVWAVVDPRAPKEVRHFRLYETGERLDENLGEYIGTVLLRDEGYVIHVFEVRQW